jgi:hypothetical protein
MIAMTIFMGSFPRAARFSLTGSMTPHPHDGYSASGIALSKSSLVPDSLWLPNALGTLGFRTDRPEARNPSPDAPHKAAPSLHICWSGARDVRLKASTARATRRAATVSAATTIV